MNKVVPFIKNLPVKNLGEPDEKEKGLNPTQIFLGKINGENKTLYAKLLPPEKLFKEIAANVLLHHLKIPQPKGYVLVLSKETIQEEYGIKIASSYYPVWATEKVNGKGAFFTYQTCTNNLMKELSEWFNFRDTLAFDSWLGNGDRHLNNLMRRGKSNFALIDHDRLFGDAHPSKLSKPMNTRIIKSYVSKNCLKQYREKARNTKINQAICQKGLMHNKVLRQSFPELRFWAKRLIPNRKESASVYNFIKTRCNPNDHIVCREYHLKAMGDS